jgi:hypothetical protein
MGAGKHVNAAALMITTLFCMQVLTMWLLDFAVLLAAV